MFPILSSLAVMITDLLGSILANISLNLEKSVLGVRMFSLSLTGMAFSWFSSLVPNSIRSWDELEQKFYDHFYSGDNETK